MNLDNFGGKLGPAPVWLWVAGGIGLVLVYKLYKNSSGGASSTLVPNPTLTAQPSGATTNGNTDNGTATSTPDLTSLFSGLEQGLTQQAQNQQTAMQALQTSFSNSLQSLQQSQQSQQSTLLQSLTQLQQSSASQISSLLAQLHTPNATPNPAPQQYTPQPFQQNPIETYLNPFQYQQPAPQPNPNPNPLNITGFAPVPQLGTYIVGGIPTQLSPLGVSQFLQEHWSLNGNVFTAPR